MATNTSCEFQTDAKLDYLGRGVDCRTPRNTWLNTLDIYRSSKVAACDSKRVKVTPIAEKHLEAVDETNQCTKSGGCGMNIKPHGCAGLLGELTVNCSTSTMTKCQKKYIVTKKVAMTSIDPDILSKDGGTQQCTKYERDLCEFILEYIQKEQTDLGKQIADLKDGNPEDKLEKYLSEAKKSKEIWQMVADACSFFLDETKCTHYVCCIGLGAVLYESMKSKEHSTNIACKAGGNAVESVDCSCQAQYQGRREENASMIDERGEIDGSTDSVTTEEVIEVTLTPVFELIKSKSLCFLMKALLQLHCFDQSYQGKLLGPLKISCRNLNESEQEIYLQVINNKLYGTTTVEEASTFYIEHLPVPERKQFKIIYKTEITKTKCYVLPDGHQPLKLVPSTDCETKISFALKSNINKRVDIPQTTATWKRESPFFIWRPKIGSRLSRRSEWYLYITKQDKDVKQKLDQDLTLEYGKSSKPKYIVVASDKLETDNSLMLFYFTPVTEPHRDLPTSVQLDCIQSDFSEVEDEPSRQSPDSTLSGAPPPQPIQQPESSFAPGNDLPSDFFELVGKDYIFPLQMK